jgi:transcription initiation factor TFIID subunit 6
MVTDELKERLSKKLGVFLAEKVADLGDGQLVHAILVD